MKSEDCDLRHVGEGWLDFYSERLEVELDGSLMRWEKRWVWRGDSFTGPFNLKLTTFDWAVRYRWLSGKRIGTQSGRDTIRQEHNQALPPTPTVYRWAICVFPILLRYRGSRYPKVGVKVPM